MTEKSISRRLAVWFDSTKNTVLPNYSTGLAGYEADLVAIYPSGWGQEVEIKISVSDFRAEFKNKARKHRILVEGNPRDIQHPRWNKVTQEEWDAAMASPLCEKKSYLINGAEHVYGIDDWRNCDPHRCKHYWFAMPIDLALKLLSDIPAHAGLIGIHECKFNNGQVEVLKQAPKLAKSRKVTEQERSHILQCAYYRMWDFERGYRKPVELEAQTP